MKVVFYDKLHDTVERIDGAKSIALDLSSPKTWCVTVMGDDGEREIRREMKRFDLVLASTRDWDIIQEED